MHNPFGNTFESLGGPTGPVVDFLHQAAFESLSELIESEEGHLISLRAPRAGYGKTMLLARLFGKSKGVLVPIHLTEGRRVEGESLLAELLTRLTESVPATGGLTRLDFHTRRLLAHGLLPLIYSGEVPCQDKEGAVASLREHPTEAFDFHRKDASIAQWGKDRFGSLTPRLSSVLSKSSGASGRDTTYWIELFFRFSVRPAKETARIDDLMESVFGRESRFRAGAGFLDGLGSFLNLVTLVEPVVLVLDELDGLFDSGDEALRAAGSLVSLWESCRRISVVISVNDDVWDSAFASKLPAGLRDRLEDVVIRLHSLSRAEANSLISSRAGQEAGKVIERTELSADNLYPRGVLKAAREAWNHLDEIDDVPAFARESAAIAPDPGEGRRDRDSEGHTLFFSASPAPGASTAPYPPGPVMRVPLPQAFNVRRIRQSASAADVGPGRTPAGFRPPISPFTVGSAFSLASTKLPQPRRQGSADESAPISKHSPSFEKTPDSGGVSRPYPSNPPFDLSIAVETLRSENSPSAEPFAQPPESDSRNARSSGGGVRPSPFELVSPPPRRTPQTFQVPDPDPEVDTDAIDKLLRQFREQRDS